MGGGGLNFSMRSAVVNAVSEQYVGNSWPHSACERAVSETKMSIWAFLSVGSRMYSDVHTYPQRGNVGSLEGETDRGIIEQ